jgi:hypothetical protein
MVAGCHVQMSQLRSELAAAKAAAAKEVKRSAALQQDLEHLQEQATRAAVNTVDELVGDLTQGQETEDDTEQPAQQQRRPKAGSAAAAKRKQGKAGGKPAGGVAATPVAQTAVFNAGPAAELSEIEEGDEELGEDEDFAEQLAAQTKPQPQRRQQQQQSQEEGQQQDQQHEAAGGGRRPRSAKSRAQQHIKAAAAADVTPPGAAAAEDAEEPGRRVSPPTK